jgi:hypothetical protein
MEPYGGGVWAVVVAAGLSHIVQSAAFELQRSAYNQWAGGRAFAPAAARAAQRASRGQASPWAVLRLLAGAYDAVQRPFHPIDSGLAARLLAYGQRGGAAADQVAEAYRDAFRTAVLRWSWESANNRTIAIFVACLLGRPLLYFLLEIVVLNLALVALVAMNRRRAASLAAWFGRQAS